MTNIEQLYKYSDFISLKFSNLRREFGRHVLIKGIFRALSLIISIAFLIVLAEGFLYLNMNIRNPILIFFSVFGFIFFITPFLLSIMVIRNRMTSFSDFRLAEMIGKKYENVKDSLFNVLQLRDMVVNGEKGFSSALVVRSMENIAKKIETHSFKTIIPRHEVKKGFHLFLGNVILVCLLFAVSPNFFSSSANRLLHPGTDFPIPEPFSITSESGTFGILGGDSTGVVFHCNGHFPEHIKLSMIYKDYVQEENLSVDSCGRAEFSLGSVRKDVVYEGFVENNSLFIPWKHISSGIDTIRVTNRPEILSVKSLLHFPEYTGLKDQVQESNITEFYVLPGTEIQLDVFSNKVLSAGNLEFEKAGVIPIVVEKFYAHGKFQVTHDDQFKIVIEDKNGVSNLNPVIYRIRISPDAYPMITLLSPTEDIDLNESMEISLGIRVRDDYGFSKAVIKYELIKKYGEEEQAENEITFPLYDNKLTLQELYYIWDVSELGLSPEDAVEFKVEIYDNDIVNGPKKTSSKKLRARFPSLNDLFAGINEQQDEISETGDEILEQLEATKEVLEQVSLELLKDPSIKWEQKAQLEQEIKKTREAGEKLSEIGDHLEDLIQRAKENQLFNKETFEKYMQLQEAFQDIMTPELREAMERLQKAIENMDPKEIQAALKKFRSSQEEFSKELDRMLKLFQRIKIEQSIDELVKRFDDLAKRQEHLNNELDKTSSDDYGKMSELSKEEESIHRDTEIAQDLMERTENEMTEFPLMPNAELIKIIEEMKDMGLLKDLKQSQRSLKKGNKSKAQKPSQQSQENLSELFDMMKNFRDEFNKRNMDEVMADFQRIIKKTLQLSQSQEVMSKVVKDVPRQSEHLMDIAVDQQRIYQNLGHIVKDVIALSNKTFGVTPRIGKGFGKASSKMKNAIGQMENRNPHKASQEGEKAMEALNSTAIALMSEMQNLQKSGSSSGFENYLKQLQKMAGQQEGINDDTQMLGMGSPGQQMALQRIAARQQQVRKSLEQLQEEIRESTNQTGDLGGIAKDMDEVIKDLRNNKILRRTIERQQRILTRLLDAQKSLRTQSFKKERKSKTGEDIVRTSPGELPKDLGERRSLLQENLEKAMRDGYSREYEEIIRHYFEALSKEEVK